MAMYRVFAGPDQESHIEPLNLNNHSYLEAFDNISEAGVHYYPELRKMAFHPLNERRLIIHLTGEVEIGTSDGSKQIFVPGDLRLMEDVRGPGHTHNDLTIGSAFVMMLK